VHDCRFGKRCRRHPSPIESAELDDQRQQTGTLSLSQGLAEVSRWFDAGSADERSSSMPVLVAARQRSGSRSNTRLLK
jgi:hypothetical protein